MRGPFLAGRGADRAAIHARDPDRLSVGELARDRPGHADLERASAPAGRSLQRNYAARALGSHRCLVVRLGVEDEDDDPVRSSPAEADGVPLLQALPGDLELPARLQEAGGDARHLEALRVAP